MTPAPAPCTAAATPAAVANGDPTTPPALCMQLTVWTHGRWRARADCGDGIGRVFDSPFELARFLAQAPAPGASRSSGGLR